MSYDVLWKVLLGVGVTVIWALISSYFTLIQVKKDIDRNKTDIERDFKGLSGKVNRLETQMMNDRMVDIAATKEEELRKWKSGVFKEDVRR
jgi:cell division protein FtsL